MSYEILEMLILNKHYEYVRELRFDTHWLRKSAPRSQNEDIGADKCVDFRAR